VRKDAEVARQTARFEPVEWIYDGLGGKVVRWTLANGGKSEDPSAQLFVVGAGGKVLSRLEDAKAYTPAAVSEWLAAQAEAWEKEHPRTALAFVPATVTATGEGAARTVRCAEVDEARAAGRPLLVYVGRDSADEKDRPARAEAAASRKFEKGALDSKAAADAAAGWTLVRLDVADPDQAAVAASLGAERAPALLLWEPGEEKPVRLPATISGPDLAFRLRRK
jgi:hypothetical protein